MEKKEKTKEANSSHKSGYKAKSYKSKKKQNKLILISKNNLFIIFYYCAFLHFFFLSLGLNISYHEIELTIKGKGTQLILYEKFTPYPEYVIINNNSEKHIPINNSITDLTQDINIIKIIWNDTIINCSKMFYNLTNITKINMTNFNMPNIINMSNMFYGCSSLKELDLSHIDTSEVTDMSYMFSGCKALALNNLSTFNTRKVKSMSRMFEHCDNIVSLNLDNFNTESVEDISYMFHFCGQLNSLNIKNFNFSNANKVTMTYMFRACSSITSLDLRCFDTSKVNDMSYMFHSCGKLSHLDLSSFNTLKVSHFNCMFLGCKSLKSLNLSNFKTPNAKYMNNMFNNCESLISLDITNFNTISVQNMNKMFDGCKSLKFLNLKNFNTSNAKSMESMFNGCENLPELDLSNFNTNEAETISNMFNNCKSLTKLNITNFDTRKVKTMNYMFSNCTSLLSLNLESFNTSQVQDMSNLFSNCYSLTSLNINNFNISSSSEIKNIFQNCSSLQFLSFINFNLSDNIRINEELINRNNSNINRCLNIISSIIKKRENDNSFNCYSICQSNISGYYGYEYNNICYKSCPSRTNALPNNSLLCEDLYCEKYYGYYKNECISTLPDGYYVNDTELKTIDKCHSDCRTCNEKEIENNTNCNSCLNNSKFLYKGNCINSCDYGYYNDSYDNKICYCPNSDCRECSINGSNLCFSCDIENNYYPLYNDNNNGAFKCYNEEEKEGYFLNKEKKLYEKCYSTCKYCYGLGNESFHNCKECNENYKYMDDKNNCYEDYLYYYYLGSDNIYHRTNSFQCPNNYKLIETKHFCIKNCSNDTEYIYEFNNTCFLYCPFNSILSENNKCKCKYYYNNNSTIECSELIPDGYYLKSKTNIIIEKCEDKCLLCSYESVSQNNSCISCNINKGYYPIFSEKANNNSFVNCYNYTKNNDSMSNNTTEGDIKCDKFEELYFNNINNITSYCPLYYCDSSNNSFCVSNKTCPLNYPKLILNKNKCIDNCTYDLEFKYEYKNECYKACPNRTIPSFNSFLCEDILNENKLDCIPTDYFSGKCKLLNNNTNDNITIANNTAEAKDKMISNIEKEIMSGGMDELISNDINNEKKDILINEDNTLFQITSTQNQKNNKNNNISTVILGECENILKKIYGIKENQPLLIFKIDYYQPNSLIPIIGYEVYHPVNKTKLDLNYCKDANINLNIPVSINENNLFKYDPNNEYYKDECFPSTSESGTDILINDRHNEFNDNNMSLCEKECNFTDYKIDTKTAQCECGIKNKQLVISELINQNDILSHNFTNKEETSNMITMKCYYTLFTKNGLIGNIGSYILIFNTFIFLVSGIFFYKCGYHLMEDLIREIINYKKEKNENKNVINRNDTKDEKEETIKKSKKAKNIKKKKKIKKAKNRKKLNLKSNYINYNSNNSHKFYPKSNISLNVQNITNIIPNKNDNLNIDKNSQSNQTFDYCDYELNSMPYKKALKFDKRKFCTYYISLTKTKNYFLFSFFPTKDYNSTIVKISLFFLFFSIFYFINALFFDEPTIHKIYEDEGIYNFIYLVPHIFYSFAISNTLNTIIKYIFLSERNLCKIKEAKIDESYEITDKVKRCLVIKYICYFTGGVIFLVFFWYYLSSFGAVYQNTQNYLIKNTLISFSVSLVYPFIINIFGITRIIALRGRNKEFLYKMSKFINFI